MAPWVQLASGLLGWPGLHEEKRKTEKEEGASNLLAPASDSSVAERVECADSDESSCSAPLLFVAVIAVVAEGRAPTFFLGGLSENSSTEVVGENADSVSKETHEGSRSVQPHFASRWTSLSAR